MGVFDTIYVPCPTCGTRSEFQSKSGPCELGVYDLHEAPIEVLSDINRHAPNTCAKCGTQFAVLVKAAPVVMVVPKPSSMKGD
jgi:endogenous inhibitor of DNA gyrase (YacG/DUF329 family)